MCSMRSACCAPSVQTCSTRATSCRRRAYSSNTWRAATTIRPRCEARRPCLTPEIRNEHVLEYASETHRRPRRQQHLGELPGPGRPAGRNAGAERLRQERRGRGQGGASGSRCPGAGPDGGPCDRRDGAQLRRQADRKSTRLNSSHTVISYAVFCLKKKSLIKLSTSYSPVNCLSISATCVQVRTQPGAVVRARIWM